MTGWKGARERWFPFSLRLDTAPPRCVSRALRRSPYIHVIDGNTGGGGWGCVRGDKPSASQLLWRFPRGQSEACRRRARCARGGRTSLAGGSLLPFSSSLCSCFRLFFVFAGPSQGDGSRDKGHGVHGSAEEGREVAGVPRPRSPYSADVCLCTCRYMSIYAYIKVPDTRTGPGGARKRPRCYALENHRARKPTASAVMRTLSNAPPSLWLRGTFLHTNAHCCPM